MARQSTKVGTIARRISRNLTALKRDLAALGRSVHAAVASGSERPGSPGRRRAKRRLTPADRARLKIQGEYLGLVRHLSIRDRGKVKAVREKRGYPPAIRLARSLVRGR